MGSDGNDPRRLTRSRPAPYRRDRPIPAPHVVSSIEIDARTGMGAGWTLERARGRPNDRQAGDASRRRRMGAEALRAALVTGCWVDPGAGSTRCGGALRSSQLPAMRH